MVVFPISPGEEKPTELGDVSAMISIIVPLFNQLPYTVACFDSLFAHTDPNRYEVVAIDNGSTDETPAYLETLPVEKTIITNRENRGVAQAWNQGLKTARRDYVCITNNDILFPPRWLANFEEAFRAYDGVKAWYPRAIRKNRSVWDHVKDDVSRRPLETFRFSITKPHDPVVNVEYPDEDNRGNLGYFQVYKRDVFEEVGVFDEQFKMFFREDIDFFVRLERHGIERRQLRNVIMFHYESATVKTIDRIDVEHRLQDNVARFYKKWGFV